MRSVVVLPQPDGPSNVVKLAWGMSSETSSTAAAMLPAKRLLRLTRRTCGSGIGHLSETHAPSAYGPDHQQYADRHADDRDREGRGATPVEVVDQLEDSDGGHRRRGSE